MDNELENEKFSSLYLEQVLAHPDDLTALIRGDKNALTIAGSLVKRVGYNELEQQALLRDMFRLVSREGAGPIVDTADAILTLFQYRGMRSIFKKHRAKLQEAYLEAITKLTEANDIYVFIDRLLRIGKAIAPYFKLTSSRATLDTWNEVLTKFSNPDDQSYIANGLDEIVHALPPRIQRRMGRFSGNGQTIDRAPERNYSNEEILNAIDNHPELNTEEVAFDILGIMPWRVRRAVKELKDAGIIERRKPGPVPPPDQIDKDKEVLQAILDNPGMEYNEIAKDIVKMDRGRFYKAAYRLRSAGKLEPKIKNKKKDN